MFSNLLPYAEAIVGAGCVVVALMAFIPMRRYFSARPIAAKGILSVTTELTVVGWMALFLSGVLLFADAFQ